MMNSLIIINLLIDLEVIGFIKNYSELLKNMTAYK